jgi:hypothetical protein
VVVASLLPFNPDVLLLGRWPLILIGTIVLVRLFQPRSTVAISEVVREATFVVSAFLLYFVVRANVDGREFEAVQRARSLVEIEQSLGIFWEPELQRHVLDVAPLFNLVNWTYVWGHFPVIVFAAIWLFMIKRNEYPVYRNAFIISGAIGLVIYAALPVAPPRFLHGYGFVDTLTFRDSVQQVSLPPALLNEYAAVPSLHFGWNMLAGIAIVRHAPHALLKPIGVLMPAAMFTSIICTGNHFILDGVAGGAVALTGLGLAHTLRSFVHVRAQSSERLAALTAYV